MAGSAEELSTILDLEPLEVDLFRGAQARTERQRVFGTAPLPLKVLYKVSRGRYARLATQALGAGAEGTGVLR